jgi:ankyrin repeat protein
MEDALSSLSPSLDSAFEDTLSRIQRLPESRHQLGLNALMWICHAKKPMNASELSDALSIKPGQSTITPRHRPLLSVILECCQGLVAVDQKTARIHFTHYSVKEYLVKNSNKLFVDADMEITTRCLTYLLFKDFYKGPCMDLAELEHRVKFYPLISYASTFWGWHLKSLESHENIKQLTLAFLNCQNAIASANQVSRFTKGYRKLYWSAEESMSNTALHVCCNFGLDDVILDLLDQNKLYINVATKMGTTPIIRAAAGGHVPTVRILLQRGADPYLENWYGNALHCAAESGSFKTIKELIAYGMSPNPCDRYIRSPLHCTLDHDRASAFETLINLGANIDTIEIGRENEHSILHVVAYRNCLNIMDIVLKHHWGDHILMSKEQPTVMDLAILMSNHSMALKISDAISLIDPHI